MSKYNTPNIYILYTGGTIGMLHDKTLGLVPVKGNLKKLINSFNFDSKLNIKYKLDKTEKLIDSSNIKPLDWKLILKKLLENYEKYDSFIVIHGTDTLAYTASVLSFFLRDWTKTVIITGSQVPLFELRNDATRNLIDSLVVSLYNIPHVLIVFGGKILRGNRSSKVSSVNFAAYESPNFNEIGNTNVHININNELNLDDYIHKINDALPDRLAFIPSDWSLDDWKPNNLNILEYTVLPADNSIVLNRLITMKPKPNAIILRTYGIGNGPVSDKDFMKQLNLAKEKKIIIINCTQCYQGGVDMDYYNTGKKLIEAGVISGFEMTPEAIYTKLFYLFQIYGINNIEIIKKMFQYNIAGEMTNFKNNSLRYKITGYFKQYQEL